MIHFSASEGLWKCRHCSWIYAAAKPEKEIISRHKEFCLVGHTEEMASNSFSFGNQGLNEGHEIQEHISNAGEATRNMKDNKSDENTNLNSDCHEISMNGNNCNSQAQLELNVSMDTLGYSEISHSSLTFVGHAEEMGSNNVSFDRQKLKQEPISNESEDTGNVKDEKSDENVEPNGDGPEVTVNTNNCNSQEQLHLNVSTDTLGSSDIKDASLMVDAQAEIYVGNKSFKTESSQNDIEACLPDSTAKNSVDGCSKLTDETHLDERLMRIINEGISEGNVEKMVQIIKEQKSHDLLCPVCGSGITKRVILRKRKRKGVGSGSKSIQDDDFESFLSPGHDKRTTVPESRRTSQSLLVDDKEQQSILEASEEIVEERPASHPLLPIREDDEVYGCLSCFSVFFRKGKCTGPESSVDDEDKSGCFYCIPLHFDWWNTEPNKAISSNQEEPSQNIAIETSAGSVTTVSSDIRSDASLTVVTSRIKPNQKVEVEGEYSQVKPSGEKDSIEASGTGSRITSSTALENRETSLNSISVKESKDCVQSYMINGKYKQRKNDRVNDPEGVFLAPKEISSTSMVHPAKDMDTGATSYLNESANVAEEIQKSEFSCNSVKLQSSRKESLKLSESQISSLHKSNGINGVPDSDANNTPEQYPLSNQTDTLVPKAPVASEYASTQNEVDEQRGNERFCSCFPMLLHSTLSLCSEKKTSIGEGLEEPLVQKQEPSVHKSHISEATNYSSKDLQPESIQRAAAGSKLDLTEQKQDGGEDCAVEQITVSRLETRTSLNLDTEISSIGTSYNINKKEDAGECGKLGNVELLDNVSQTTESAEQKLILARTKEPERYISGSWNTSIEESNKANVTVQKENMSEQNRASNPVIERKESMPRQSLCSCLPFPLRMGWPTWPEKVDQESRLPLLQHEVNIQEPQKHQTLPSESVQRHPTFADDKEVRQMLQRDSIVVETSDHQTVIGVIDTPPTDTTNVLANAPESPLEPVPQANLGTEWDILKSVVYGGLPVSITSLGIISSAAGAGAKTLDVIVICLGHLFSGFLMIVNNMSSLDESQFIESVGHRHRFNGFVAILSYFIFGTCAPIAYGLSFRKSDDVLKKFIVASGVSLIAIIFLSLSKARVSGRSYIRTLVLYVVTGFWASIAGFLAGEYIKKLLQKWGIKLD